MSDQDKAEPKPPGSQGQNPDIAAADDAPGAEPAKRRFASGRLRSAGLAVLGVLIVGIFLVSFLIVQWPDDLGGQIAVSEEEAGERVAEESTEQQVEPEQGELASPAPEAAAGDLVAPERELAGLRADLDAAEARLGRVESGLAEAQQPTIDLAGRLDVLELRLAEAEGRVAQAADSQSLAALIGRVNNIEAQLPPVTLDAAVLGERVAALEDANSALMLQRAAATLALAELARAATSANDFTLELQALDMVAPDDPALSRLAPHTAGVPTIATLVARFAERARAAIDADRAASAEGILARLWNSITGIVQIRRVGNVAGDDTRSVLARAEAALESENLERAVAEIRTLDGASVEAMAVWQTDATARLAVDRAISDMNARMTQTLAIAARERGGAR